MTDSYFILELKYSSDYKDSNIVIDTSKIEFSIIKKDGLDANDVF